MKVALSAFALAAAVAAPSLALAAGDLKTGYVFALSAQNGSGEHGTFAIKPHAGGHTTLEIHLLGAPEGIAQPAHVHLGTCAKLDPSPLYPLKSVVDGISETSLDVPLAKLMAQGVAVNIHESTSKLTDYVACGDVTK